MYTGHFGLDEGPFHGRAEGREVYVGPQQSALIARLKKVLALPDTAIAVNGPVGVGKTTLVRHAIGELIGSKIVVPVDRMRLEPDEVLDLLLVRFDVSRRPKGTVQRVAAFRRLLQEKLADDVRIFIVVEDAQRVGNDALLEIEALTAIDGGEPSGANIVLMGGDELPALLADPALARLRQRIRLRQVVTPFDAAEVEGYMRHCLESAGGAFEQIFERGTADIVYRYSGGTARVVDTLCESALVAAAEAGVATILPEFLEEIAASCGLEPLPGNEMSHAPATPAQEYPVTDAAPAAGGPKVLEEEAPEEDALEAPVPEAAAPEAATPEEAAPEAAGPEAAGPEEAGPEEAAPEEAAPAACRREDVVAVDVAGSEAAADDAEESPVVSAPEAAAAPPKLALVPPLPDGGDLSASRIDQVLPELLVRLQAAARGSRAPVEQSRMADEPPREPAEPTGDESSDDIPTLSNSMRIAVLPTVRRDEPEEDVSGEVSAEIAAEMPVESSIESSIEPSIEPSVESSVESSVEPSIEPSIEPSVASPAESPVDPSLEETAEAEHLTLDDPDLAAAAAAAGFVTPEEDRCGDCPEETGRFELSLAPDRAPDGSPSADEPELDALQAAIHAANAWQAGDATQNAENDPTLPAAADEPELPEITLERTLGETPGADTADDALDRWADELSRAKSLEDISDMLAETLFGSEEMQQASAAIREKSQAETAPAPTAGPPATPAPAARAAPTRPAVKPASPRPGSPSKPGGMNLTMSQRIEMLNSLNKGKTPKRMPPSHVAEIVLAGEPDAPPRLRGQGPESIEAQIDTAITQTRKALSEADLAKLAASDNDGDDGNKGSRGLFGLFRRSSRR